MSTPVMMRMQASFQGRRRRFPISARDYEASSLMSIDPKRRRSITGAKWAVRLNGSLVPARDTNQD
jgi:hypothetical protein